MLYFSRFILLIEFLFVPIFVMFFTEGRAILFFPFYFSY